MSAQPVVFDFEKEPPTRAQIRAAAKAAARKEWVSIGLGLPLAGLLASVVGLSGLMSAVPLTFGLAKLLGHGEPWYNVLGSKARELSLKEMAELPAPQGLPAHVTAYMEAIAAQGRHPVLMEADLYREACEKVGLLRSAFVARHGFS